MGRNLRSGNWLPASVLAAATVAFGVWLRSSALLAVGVGIAGLLVYISIRSRTVTFAASRSVVPSRVKVGNDAREILEIRNSGRGATRKTTLYETIGASTRAITVGRLKPGESHITELDRLPTHRRGPVVLGPLRVGSIDPFGLRGTAEHALGKALLIVHPESVPLAPFPAGRTRDLDGPTSNASLEGGIEFFALREHQLGDDDRLVHWKSTARLGRKMVRQNADPHQPFGLIVLDCSQTSYETEEHFEQAVIAAASLVAAGAIEQNPVGLAITGTGILVGCRDGLEFEILDALADATLQTLGTPETFVGSLRVSADVASVVLVTGSLVGSSVAVALDRFPNPVVARVGVKSSRLTESDGVWTIDAKHAADFARQWSARFAR